MKPILEVKIKKLKVNYRATCDLFPQCVGVGKTKVLALQQLSKSISQSVSTMLNTHLDDMFSEVNYTDIMFNHAQDDLEEIRAYSFNAKSSSNTQMAFRLPYLLLDLKNKRNDEQAEEEAPSFDPLFESSMFKDEDDDEYETVSFPQKSTLDSDSILFGFPLNFN